MLARHFRLRRPEDFRAVQRAGKRWANAYLVLGCLPNQRNHNRYGFVVSKRLGKATVRNRVRRRLRASVRRRMSGHRPGFDVVIIARLPAASASYARLDEALADLEERAKLLTVERSGVGKRDGQ